MYIKSRNAEVGTRNVQAVFCIHHSPVDRSSNNTPLPPPSRITSTYRRTIGVRHHSSSIRHISPIDSIRLPLPASRFTTTGTPRSSRVTSTRCCTLRARSLSALFRVPRSDFRVCSRFKVDQRVASFGEARPRLHLDHVIQVRALEPELDFLGGAREGAPPPGPRGGARVPREQLQLRGARCERRELDGEPLHRADGRDRKSTRLNSSH